MDKPKPIRLKYIPTDMYAVRYFKEKPFIVPEGMQFAYSENIDFSQLNLELKTGGKYKYLFQDCKNCKIDIDKIKLNQISKDSTAIFYYLDSTEIIGELPVFNDNQYYFYFWEFDEMTDEYVFELADKISNMKFIDGKLKGNQMFYYFPYNSNFYVRYDDNRGGKAGSYFPKLDLSKWTINSVDRYNTSSFFYGSHIYRLKMFRPTEVADFSISGLWAEILENYDFSKFKQTYFSDSNTLYVFYGNNLGAISNITSYNFTEKNKWGDPNNSTHLKNIQGEILDRATPEESRLSLTYTLVDHSFDRASAGYPTCTINLSSTTKSLLTSEEIAQITAKGFTIA